MKNLIVSLSTFAFVSFNSFGQMSENLIINKDNPRIYLQNTSSTKWSKSAIRFETVNSSSQTTCSLFSEKNKENSTGNVNFGFRKLTTDSKWLNYLYINDISNDIIFNYNNTSNQEFGNIIFKNGTVLIGKDLPQNSAYRLDVAGSIRANEVKVNLDGADFVFEDSYTLKTLQEVENYIKENKKLPGIEPAKEMEAKGANLGELNSKLLQKIEELTLYVIQLNKDVEDLKEKNKLLEKRLLQK